MRTARLAEAGSTASRGLLFVLATGGSPALPARSAGLFRIRLAVLIGCAVVAALLGTLPYFVGSGQPDPLVVSLLGVGCVLPLPLAAWQPLLAWRLLVMLGLIAPLLYDPTALSGWPWTFALGIAFAVVLYLLGERHSQAVLVWAWLISTAGFAVQVPHWRDVLLLAVAAAGILILGNAIQLRRQAEGERAEQQERRAAEQARNAVLEERTRIARELHDVVAHHMSVLAVRADSAAYRLPDVSEPVRAEFAELHQTARDGLTEMRRLLGVLRTGQDGSPVEPQPGLEQVAELVDRMRATGTTVRLSLSEDAELSGGIGLSVYRIVQEALSNAATHAPGAEVDVEISRHPDQFRIRVHNTAAPGARGADEARRPRHGLLGMRERTAMLGGSLDAGPTEDGGFAVAAILPLDREGAQ